jgi:hypothetical protein
VYAVQLGAVQEVFFGLQEGSRRAADAQNAPPHGYQPRPSAGAKAA